MLPLRGASCFHDWRGEYSDGMLRTIFISVFLSLYILIVGPPLIVYTLMTRAWIWISAASSQDGGATPAAF